jgi:hypothetical protein
VESFGRQCTVEVMALIGDYFTVGMMANAADQHLPPDGAAAAADAVAIETSGTR